MTKYLKTDYVDKSTCDYIIPHKLYEIVRCPEPNVYTIIDEDGHPIRIPTDIPTQHTNSWWKIIDEHKKPLCYSNLKVFKKCDHHYEYQGHGHNYSIYKCTKCGNEIEE